MPPATTKQKKKNPKMPRRKTGQTGRVTSTPNTTETTEKTAEQIVNDIDKEIEALKQRRLQVQQLREETPSTSGITGLDDHRNQSAAIPIDSMITLIKQIRNDLKPLPKFYGDVLEWPAFIEEYERTSASHTLSDFEKHERLNKALKGDARDLVSEKLKSTIFLNQVVAELRKKYGGKANIIKAAISKVDKIQRLGSNLKHIKKFVHDAITVQWMIQHYKEDGLETTLLIKMLDLIPSTIRLRWGDYQREIMKDGYGE